MPNKREISKVKRTKDKGFLIKLLKILDLRMIVNVFLVKQTL